VVKWQQFDQADLAALVAAGQVVLVDVTADWCLTCKVNKALVLDQGPVNALLGAGEVIGMRADWTNPDPVIAGYLASFGRYGIPFNAVYGPGAVSGIALPELLSADRVLAEIAAAGRKK
jgi:suppressor for copper-sensitivity B